LVPATFCGSGVVRIGTVGRLQQVKDQATLLRAFAALCAALPTDRSRLRLLIVGDGPLLGDLRALAISLGIADAVWFPGALDTIPEVLRAMDIFVLPSLNEGISNTLLEAMASGLPVVATAVGGNLELVEDGVCGRFFQPGDHLGLAQLLAEYAADPASRGDHGRAARNAVLNKFSLEAMVASYEAIYDRVLGY
ncbi:MAG: glycosyltransferase, partial [Gammaproteobacteria bacterium]